MKLSLSLVVDVASSYSLCLRGHLQSVEQDWVPLELYNGNFGT